MVSDVSRPRVLVDGQAVETKETERRWSGCGGDRPRLPPSFGCDAQRGERPFVEQHQSQRKPRRRDKPSSGSTRSVTAHSLGLQRDSKRLVPVAGSRRDARGLPRLAAQGGRSVLRGRSWGRWARPRQAGRAHRLRGALLRRVSNRFGRQQRRGRMPQLGGSNIVEGFASCDAAGRRARSRAGTKLHRGQRALAERGRRNRGAESGRGFCRRRWRRRHPR
jgi:hypothetical protein